MIKGDIKLLTELMIALLVTYLLLYVTNRSQERLLGKIGQRLMKRFRTLISSFPAETRSAVLPPARHRAIS